MCGFVSGQRIECVIVFGGEGECVLFGERVEVEDMGCPMGGLDFFVHPSKVGGEYKSGHVLDVLLGFLADMLDEQSTRSVPRLKQFFSTSLEFAFLKGGGGFEEGFW